MNDNPVLSLCLIARDSARTLGACLASIRPWVDEMVVIDTGSSDETPQIAQQFGARVFEFPWCDDFSAARNESLARARGAWLFWMDSDDTIDQANGRRLRELVDSTHPPETLGYVMQVHCPGPCAHGETDCTVVDHVKLIRNLPALRFDGRIHEQVLPAIRQVGGEVGWTDIHVVHSGSDQSPAGRQRKQERDLRILLLELGERPEHPFTLFNLGMTYADMADHPLAIDYLKRSIAVAAATESHLRKAYALLVNSLAQLDRLDEAGDVCQAGRKLFPDDPELLFRHAILAHQQRQLEEAERSYIELLEQHGPRHFSSIDPGILGYKVRHNLAAVYQDMGRPDLAELQWRAVLCEMPSYRLGWRNLVEIQIKAARYRTAELDIGYMVDWRRCAARGCWQKRTWPPNKGSLLPPNKIFRPLCMNIRARSSRSRRCAASCSSMVNRSRPGRPSAALADRLPDDGAVWHNLGTVNARLGDYAAAAAAYQESLRLRPESEQTRRELAQVQRLHAEQSKELETIEK